MKKIILIITILLLSQIQYSFSQGLGIGIGPSFPLADNILNQINSVNDVITQVNKISSDIQNQANMGLNLNLRIKLGESPLRYCLNFGWNRFSNDKATFVYNNNKFDLNLVRNIYPLSGGIQFDVLPLDVVKVYLTGDISCNIIDKTIDYSLGNYTLPISLPITTVEHNTRFGGALGTGVEIKLLFLTLDVNAKVHFINLIKGESSEPSQSFIMSNVSIFFGK